MTNKVCNTVMLTDFEYEELKEKARQSDVLAEALDEAVGWNWLDDDMPDDIYDQCHAALNNYRNASCHRKSKGE